MAPPSDTARLARWMLPLLVLCGAWVAQGGVLENDWVRDDAALVRDNPVLHQGLRGLPDVFAPGFVIPPCSEGGAKVESGDSSLPG